MLGQQGVNKRAPPVTLLFRLVFAATASGGRGRDGAAAPLGLPLLEVSCYVPIRLLRLSRLALAPAVMVIVSVAVTTAAIAIGNIPGAWAGFGTGNRLNGRWR